MKPDDIEPPAKEAPAKAPRRVPTKGSLADAAQRTPLAMAMEQIERLDNLRDAFEMAKVDDPGLQECVDDMACIYDDALEAATIEALAREPSSVADVFRLTILASSYIGIVSAALDREKRGERRIFAAIVAALEGANTVFAQEFPKEASALPDVLKNTLAIDRHRVEVRRNAIEAVS